MSEDAQVTIALLQKLALMIQFSKFTEVAQVQTIDLSLLDRGVFVDTDQNSRGFAGIPTQKGFVRDVSVLDTPDGFSKDFETPQIDIVDIEGIIGTRFGDTLFGGQENDTIFGGAGNDQVHPFAGVNFIDGEEGKNTLLLNALPVGVTTDLVTGVAGNNVIANFENVQGSDIGGDVILGDILDNKLDGNGGSDTIEGAAGDDTLLGEIITLLHLQDVCLINSLPNK